MVGGVAVLVLNVMGVSFYLPGGDKIVSYVIRPEIDVKIVVLALSFSVGAAALASVYPSNRASNMDPVDALRSV